MEIKGLRGKLKKEFGRLSGNWIVMLETAAEKSLQVGVEAIRILNSNGMRGMIISASRPCSDLESLYGKNGIDTKKIYTVCCVCKSKGINARDNSNVHHVEGVNALTEISIEMNELISKLSKENSFFFIDSISLMLVHNNQITLARFIHSIITKMRLNGVKGILVSLQDETGKEIRAELAQLCDKVIKI